ncbi:MAG TPA: hypothetical protein HPP83_10975 [Candidatus Hydrogenedentes bacterium]|nr:hypothetical protein [Candidatus Hydrogenedentota bacterium]
MYFERADASTTKTTLLAATLLLVGCATNLYKYREYEIVPPRDVRPEVFVENPELKKELRILKHSKLFEISEDPSVETHIELHPLKEPGYCGMPALPALFTLGLIPGSGHTLSPYGFEYGIDGPQGKHRHSYVLPSTYRRISLWEWFFKPFKNENCLLGRILRTEAVKAAGEEHAG